MCVTEIIALSATVNRVLRYVSVLMVVVCGDRAVRLPCPIAERSRSQGAEVHTKDPVTSFSRRRQNQVSDNIHNGF